MRRSSLLVVLFMSIASARAQTSYPMITRVQPTAIQRGQAAELTIAGTQDFSGASALLFEGTGLTAQVVGADGTKANGGMRGRAAATAVRARVAVAPEAELGPRELRVVTPQGVSSVGQLVVVADPVVAEADDQANDLPTGAQELALPTVVAGAVGKPEDVDWYVVRAEAGQWVTFSLWGNRLEDKIHDLQTHLDPILGLRDATGRELAVDDNAQFADPRLSYQFRAAGMYYLQVRDTTYAGNPNWTYVLQVTSGPFVTSAFPLAVRPGATAELKAQGHHFDESQAIALAVPGDTPPGPRAFSLPTAQGLSQPVGLVVTELPPAVETDDAPEEGQAVTLPAAVSGRLGTANDGDGYRFEAKTGQIHAFEVVSRRVGSMADPVLRLADAQGKTLTEVDDALGKDPRLEWTAPADGPYVVYVRDLHGRGGADFGYVLLAEPARPDFVLTCDPDKLNIGPGARTPVFVKVERRGGFPGPITVTCRGLPAGVSASPLVIPPHMTQGEIVLAASDSAALGGALLTLAGRAETAQGPVEHVASPRQEIYLPGGGRGTFGVATLALAVTRPSDITVEAHPTEVTLAPGGTATLEVTVTRHGGFDQGV
ncbi:MAG TPA: pre-peptidase, partial [Isosphaeraceae bacterium]